MSPRFSDGSFRIKNEKTGLMEYRFILGGRVESVYGYSDKECWQLRTEAIAGKKKKAKHSKPIMTVSDWIWQFYKLFRESGLSEQCKTEQVKHIERINANIGSSPLKNLNTEDVQKFTNSLSATSNTRKKIYGFLRAALDKAVRLGHLKRNPCDEVLVPKHKAASYPVLQLAQQRLLLENINEPKYATLFMFCCCTGLRIGEALNAEIDTANDVVYVVDEDTATKKHQRQIPLLSNRLTGLDLIAGIKKSAAQTYFKRLFKRLGIRAVVHSFRVTFISCCSYVGINPKQIQAWAGHRNFETTMNTYAKVIRKDGTTPILDYLRELKTLVCD